MFVLTTNTGSKGNGYILHTESEDLLIEAGVKFKETTKTLDYKVANIKGLIVSHEHG